MGVSALLNNLTVAPSIGVVLEQKLREISREIKDQIISLLDDWKVRQPPAKPEKRADLEK